MSSSAPAPAVCINFADRKASLPSVHYSRTVRFDPRVPGFVGTYGTKQPEDKVPGGVTMGGYSSDIVVDEAFVIRVPEKMNVAAATPLLCAGITCYSPFKNHGIKAGDHLGIVGLGGLGHMAVKIGAAMGCVVTVITRCAHRTLSLQRCVALALPSPLL